MLRFNGSRIASAFVACVLGLSAGPAVAQLVPTISSKPLIIGGVESKPETRRWQVALVKTADADNFSSQFCGGSLIGNRWVLTASHCLMRKNQAGEPEVMPASAVAVLVGTSDLTAGGRRIAVAEVIVHAGYNASTKDNDIALLRLSADANAGRLRVVTPAQESKLASPGIGATVTGWGNTSTSGNSYPSKLMEVKVPITEFETCRKLYQAQGASVTDRMLCAGFKDGGKDSCQGDSGGPLVVSDQAGGAVQVGIVSWGYGCAVAENYGVYARLAKFNDWIRARVPAETCTPQQIQDQQC